MKRQLKRAVGLVGGKARRALVVALGGLVAAGGIFGAASCADDRPLEAIQRQSPARTLDMFSHQLSEDVAEQVYEGLRRDAWRREHRFRNAATPGYLFDATRVAQGELEAGLWQPDEIFQLGAQLFNLQLTRDRGFGARDLPPMGRFHLGRRGGPDAYRCASCHRRGGPAGAGDAADNAYLDGDGRRQSTTLERNAPALHGSGLIELLALEMSKELQRQREAARAHAAKTQRPAEAFLSAKGVRFGSLLARPDGSLDHSNVKGVSSDLVVRPFGWKGSAATLRHVVEEELLIHHGMQSTFLVATAEPERVGPFGGLDPDGDGVTAEISEGQLTVLSLYTAMQEVPVMDFPAEPHLATAWARGQQEFERLGCAGCHVPALPLDSTEYVLNSREGTAAVRIDLAKFGATPRLQRSPTDGRYWVYLFSDLRRHAMGPDLAESRPDRGIAADEFRTPALWGLSRSRPYLHDARAPTIEAAILAHGGEAAAARDGYAALSEVERGPVRIYLQTMTRAVRMMVP